MKVRLYQLLLVIYSLAGVTLSRAETNLRESTFDEAMALIDGSGCFRIPIKLFEIGSGNQTIPVFFTFSTDPFHSQVPMRGWKLPLIESRAVLVDEQSVDVLTPWGEDLGLRLDPLTNQLRSHSDWNGNVDVDGDLLRLKSDKAGDVLIFKKGKISEYSHGGKGLVWVYDTRGGVKIIRKNSKKGVVECRNEGSGANRQMIFSVLGKSGNREPISISYIDPQYINLDELESRGINVGVEELIFPDRKISFRKIDAGAGRSGLEIDRNGHTEMYQWETDSGEAVRCNQLDVSIDHVWEKYAIPQITLISRDAKKIVQLPQNFDPKKGFETVRHPDGSIDKLYYSIASSNQKFLRRKVRIAPDGTVEDLYRASFDADGNILRDKRGGLERVFKDGRYQVFKDGVLIREY